MATGSEGSGGIGGSAPAPARDETARQHARQRDDELADRVRTALGAREWSERRMFGGLAFLLGGHMAVAVSGQGGLMVRCEPADTDAHTSQPGVERMVMRAKALTGWLLVDLDALAGDADLQRWVDIGAAYVAPLPPKA